MLRVSVHRNKIILSFSATISRVLDLSPLLNLNPWHSLHWLVCSFVVLLSLSQFTHVYHSHRWKFCLYVGYINLYSATAMSSTSSSSRSMGWIMSDLENIVPSPIHTYTPLIDSWSTQSLTFRVNQIIYLFCISHNIPKLQISLYVVWTLIELHQVIAYKVWSFHGCGK